MSLITDFHTAVRLGHLDTITTLLTTDRTLANCRSETDARGTYPLHVAAEFGQAEAARLLVSHGADVSLRDAENDAIALCWAAFFGRPGVVRVLLAARSDPNQRNTHGLTSLGCALDGTRGRWKQFSNASWDDWKACTEAVTAYGGTE